MTEAVVHIEAGNDFADIRDSVRRVCADFPGAYWRKLEETGAYPSEFVQALTDAGFLSALIPEEYGGSGMPLRAAAVILEEIHATGCNAGTNDIPAVPANLANFNMTAMTVTNGIITQTSTTNAGARTSVLTPVIDNGALNWTQTGTCTNAPAFCKQ